jgi:hypothetical protein
MRCSSLDTSTQQVATELVVVESHFLEDLALARERLDSIRKIPQVSRSDAPIHVHPAEVEHVEGEVDIVRLVVFRPVRRRVEPYECVPEVLQQIAEPSKVPGLPSEYHRIELEVDPKLLELFSEIALEVNGRVDLLPVLAWRHLLVRPSVA